jgi:ribosomal protein S26
LWPAATADQQITISNNNKPHGSCCLSLAYCSAAAVFFLRMWISEEKKRRRRIPLNRLANSSGLLLTVKVGNQTQALGFI